MKELLHNGALTLKITRAWEAVLRFEDTPKEKVSAGSIAAKEQAYNQRCLARAGLPPKGRIVARALLYNYKALNGYRITKEKRK